MQPKDPNPSDTYPTLDIEKYMAPIGTAKFQEPIFSKGEFIGQYLEVSLTLYPFNAERDGTELVAVRFGQMDVLRFVDPNLLYDVVIYEKDL